MKKIRFGYVGCGGLAQRVHLPNFKMLPECDFVALAEIRPQLLNKVADRFGIAKRYTHHLQMAEDESIEAVGISGGWSQQGELAADFLRRGKAVFLEKPMATSMEQARRILAAMEEGGGRLMIAHMYRYDAGNQLAKDHIRQFRQGGEAGKLTYIRMHGFGGDWHGGIDLPVDATDEKYPEAAAIAPDWMPARWQRPYFLYLQQFCHNVNLTRWFLDSTDKPKVKFVDLDDDGYVGTVGLEFQGVRCNLETGKLAGYQSWDDHTKFYFERGWVKRSTPPLLLRNVPCTVEVYRTSPKRELIHPTPDPAWSWSYKREAEAFLRAVQSGAPFGSEGVDSLPDVELFEDIYREFLKQRGEL